MLLVSGGPPSISGPLIAHYSSVRWEALKKAGAGNPSGRSYHDAFGPSDVEFAECPLISRALVERAPPHPYQRGAQ